MPPATLAVGVRGILEPEHHPPRQASNHTITRLAQAGEPVVDGASKYAATSSAAGRHAGERSLSTSAARTPAVKESADITPGPYHVCHHAEVRAQHVVQRLAAARRTASRVTAAAVGEARAGWPPPLPRRTATVRVEWRSVWTGRRFEKHASMASACARAARAPRRDLEALERRVDGVGERFFGGWSPSSAATARRGFHLSTTTRRSASPARGSAAQRRLPRPRPRARQRARTRRRPRAAGERGEGARTALRGCAPDGADLWPVCKSGRWRPRASQAASSR